MPDEDRYEQLRVASSPVIAEASHRAIVARLLARAFADDPVMDWIVRSDDKRPMALELLFDTVIGGGVIPLGQVHIALENAAALGCAAWVPPPDAGRPMGLIEQIRLLPDMIRLTSLSRLPRLLKLLGALERHHPREPHFYLYFLGVDPDLRGRGLGSALLEASLKTVDRLALPAYLENSKPRNSPLYRRYGFVTKTVFRAAPDAPPMESMWRPAATSR